MKTTTSARLGYVFAATVAVLTGVAAAALPPPVNHVVTIANMRFGKVPAGLKVGDTIEWVNTETVPHTVTARDKSFDLRLAPQGRARMTVTKVGSFAYYCIYHAQMRGVLTVAG